MAHKIDYRYIKLIALISMFCDHVGAVLYPEETWLRYIGRLAFPIFLFLIVNSYTYTRSKAQLIKRIVIFTLVSELPYHYALYKNYNIGFTLLIVLLVINSEFTFIQKRIDKKKLDIFAIISGLGLIFISFIWSELSYGWFAVFTGVLLYNRDKLGKIWFIVLTFMTGFLYSAVYPGLTSTVIISLPVIWILVCTEDWFKYSKQTLFVKNFYYIFYPAHLAILAIFRYMISNY